MANPGLLDLPVSVLLIILLLLEADDHTYANVLAFCFVHPQTHQFLTGKPHLTLTFPQPVTDPFFKLHDVFINRSLRIFDGLQHKRFYHFHPSFQLWFEELDLSIGRRGIAELVFRLLRLDVIELLCGDLPPTLEQWTALAQEETGNFFASYILLLQYEDAIYIYCGSALDQIDGFLRRLSDYMNLRFSKMPQFIANLISQKKEFRILQVLPILRIFPDERMDIVVGDVRVLVFLIETMMMSWNRALLPDTKWEKLMEFSPWTKDMNPFVRINRGLSTKLEWPKSLLKSEEALAASKEIAKARDAAYKAKPERRAKARAAVKAYRAKPGVKAKEKAYRAKPEVKAKAKAHEAKPERKAKRAASRAKPEAKAKAKAYAAKPEVKATKKAYAAKPETKAKNAAYKAKPERRAKARAAAKAYRAKPEVKAKAKAYRAKPEVKAKAKAHEAKPERKAKKAASDKKRYAEAKGKASSSHQAA